MKKRYYLTDVFGNKTVNEGESIDYILSTYRYFNSKDRIVSIDYKEKYSISVDRPNKTITLKSVNGNRVLAYKKDRDGKYVEVE